MTLRGRDGLSIDVAEALCPTVWTDMSSTPNDSAYPFTL